MNRELVELLRSLLSWYPKSSTWEILKCIEQEGYVIIKKDKLIKVVGLAFAEELGVK